MKGSSADSVTEKPLAEVDSQPVIQHFPVQPAENNRPVYPHQKEKFLKWQVSRKTALRSAFICTLALLLIFFNLLMQHFRLVESGPVQNKQLKAMKQMGYKRMSRINESEDRELRERLESENELLFKKIRELDLKLRESYFSLLDKKDPGISLMFVLLIALFVSLRVAWKYNPATPFPIPALDKAIAMDLQRKKSKFSVGFAFMALLSIGVSLYVYIDSGSPGERYRKTLMESAQDPVVEAKNWSQFLGRGSQVDRSSNNYPFEFDLESGVNVKWRSTIPLEGISSPVIHAKRIFITGANDKKRVIYAYHADTGKRLWAYDVKSLKEKEAPEVYESYMYAASTVSTDGEMVYACLANGDLLAVDFKGKLVWQKDLGLPENDYGHSSSLILHGEKLIVTWDHDGENSKIFTLDKKSGKEIWSVDRSDFEATWSTPVVVRDGGVDQLITSNNNIVSYDLKDGRELWSSPGMTGDLGSSPYAYEGWIYSIGDDGKMLCLSSSIKLKDGENRVRWSNEDLTLPDIPTPLSDGEKVWLVASNGELTCLEAKSGKILYVEDLGIEVYASPILMGDKIMILGNDGDCLFVSTEGKYKKISEGTLDDSCLSPASLYKDRIYVRRTKELVCLQKKSSP